MAIPRDRQSAKELVQQIAKDHGYLGEEKLRRIEPDLRREIEEAFLKKDLMIGSTVITLAKNLYTSKARFVFELLQNADDNKFEKAVALGSVPFVSFRVYPRKIVLECNEDGFNHDNLVAICSVGKSSKTGAQGYIGEKGIGFKSVFMAAWKAHIQSGSFSFSFTHRNGDSGMGMISPVWEEASDQPTSQLTRITLHLHDTGDADVLKKTREIIQEQFEELEETILLFMKNLRRVNVSFYDEDGDETSSAAYSIKRPRTTFAILERTKTINGTTQTQVKHFHVTTHQATNLAKNENRTYSDTEEATRAYSKSQITLAFPVTEASVPVIEPQNVFVFLPVRPVGFKFLIQADFVTDASRQDIVRDSLRNNGLIDGIAEAFVKAILQFCRHDTLRYQWMRYLPDKNSTNWNGLWLALVNRIAGGLARAAVLYGQKRADGRLIKDLVRLQTDHLDENGEPLFDDVEPEQMISRRYRDSDLDLLRSYGLDGGGPE
ncbi:putative ino80 chromatin remodeling complex protein [Phaeoacremonium minimum UCRPA7]|uniref:Putative ino80 chromatin remodeling complex protein n=1 Tax=Phaeoacremonium minimum (strain UCR-PA7) TaxID=1286976 RepID=R8BA28_PHAM7|nr:putative ino80 chromatin remodeling complex protein [Phaeoacremonium minimum UCRPA7]EON96180.1 putative ino80 chromatin remodeling complex protein [Phaeoacremonium minimum UCRPA7]